jgi:hypothetical protein
VDGRPPWHVLNEIVLRAYQDHAFNFDLICLLAFKCAANQHTAPHPDAAQEAHVLNALNAARSKAWAVVAWELDHDTP